MRRGLIKQLETKKVSTGVRIFLRLMTFSNAQLNLVDIFVDRVLHRANTSTNRDGR